MSEDVQHAFRAPEDEPLFKKPTVDRGIVPDRMTAGVEGYFPIPAIWVGEEPDSNAQLSLNGAILHAVVYTTTLSFGIEVRVQRNGTFLFDFSSWPVAPQVTIPGYRIPDPDAPYRQPKETVTAENKAEEYALYRAQVMNVHQLCMLTSWWKAKRYSIQIGNPVVASGALKHLTFSSQHPHDEDIESITKYREVWDIEIIKLSLELLDQILIHEDLALIEIVEAMYFATFRYSENRFGEALILAWEVCEQLIYVTWENFLRDRSIRGKRKERLEGVNYTVSIMVEILELNGELAHELYLDLDTARSARNSWVHKMQMPGYGEVDKAFRSAEKLLLQVKGISLSLITNGPGGGVPQWPVGIWDQVQKEQKGAD